MKTLPVLAALAVLVLVGLSSAFQYAPPAAVPPEPDTLKSIEARAQKLSDKITQLRRAGVRDPALADIEIYYKAAYILLKHGEFYDKNIGETTLAVLDRGLLRASQQARGESPWLTAPGQTVVRAYRSGIDGSLQPYAVTYPSDYGKD